MSDVPTSILFTILFFLIILSGFFSGSETGMMALNRYRLRHLVKQKHPAALRVSRLLDRTDRLIGVILIGNNFVNILASAIATVIAIRLLGDKGIAVATGLLTLVILIFAEVTPKTIAAYNPERVAFSASMILGFLLKLLYPFVWIVNHMSNWLVRLLGIKTDIDEKPLSTEELRTFVHEAGTMIPRKRKKMLLNIFDLEKVTVNDIMIPRNDIVGIDIEDELDTIVEQLRTSHHTRLPVYKNDMNNIIGLLHMKRAARLLVQPELTKAAIMQESSEPYFIPENTPLNTQLVNFQQIKRRIALVVDEYGDLQGLVTLEDILEEIVGEFTTEIIPADKNIQKQNDGSYIIDGNTAIRVINRLLNWKLPIDGPKTISGLIIEILEAIPESAVCLKLDGYYIEILQVKDNVIKTTRIRTMKQKVEPDQPH